MGPQKLWEPAQLEKISEKSRAAAASGPPIMGPLIIGLSQNEKLEIGKQKAKWTWVRNRGVSVRIESLNC